MGFNSLKPARLIFQEQSADKPPVTETGKQQEITSEENPDKGEAEIKANNAVNTGYKALNKVVSATGTTGEFIRGSNRDEYEGKQELSVQVLPLSPKAAALKAQLEQEEQEENLL